MSVISFVGPASVAVAFQVVALEVVALEGEAAVVE
jgi:hypothetical protein